MAEVEDGLSNGTIFNDLERPQTQVSRSGHFLMLNISEMAKYTAVVAANRKPYASFRMVPFSMALNDP